MLHEFIWEWDRFLYKNDHLSSSYNDRMEFANEENEKAVPRAFNDTFI